MDNVKRFNCTNGGVSFCQGCYQMDEDEDGTYVYASDYDVAVSVGTAFGNSLERVVAERDALQLLLNERDEHLHTLEQSRRAEFDNGQAAERRIAELCGQHYSRLLEAVALICWARGEISERPQSYWKVLNDVAEKVHPTIEEARQLNTYAKPEAASHDEPFSICLGCFGAGTICTGIAEASSTICNGCNGTGRENP